MSMPKRLAVLVAPGILLGIAFLTTLPFWNAKGDDAFITFRFVKNLVEHQELAYNLGEPVYGFTSPLWLGLLSAIYAIIRDMYVSSWIASFFSLGLMAFAFWLLSSQIIENVRLRYLAVVVTLVDPWFMRWAFSGQEIVFKIAVAAILIVALGQLLREKDTSTKSGVFVGLLLGVGCLTRPEFLLLVLIAVAFLGFQRRFRTLIVLTLAFLAIYGTWAYFCYQHFGFALPHTILVKTDGLRPVSMSERISILLNKTAPRFGQIVLLPALGLLGSLVFVLVKYGTKRIHFKDSITTKIILLWVVGCLLGYTLTSAFVMSMYTLLYSPFIALLGFAVLDGVQFEMPRRAVRLGWLSLGVGIVYCVLALTLKLGWFSWLVGSQYARGEGEEHIQFAEWVRGNLPKDARIATHELGVLGYYGERYTIDIAGIATPELLTGDFGATLRGLKPTHFWLYESGLKEFEGMTLEPIKEIELTRIGGSYSTSPCVLYRVVSIPEASPAKPALAGTTERSKHLSE